MQCFSFIFKEIITKHQQHIYLVQDVVVFFLFLLFSTQLLSLRAFPAAKSFMIYDKCFIYLNCFFLHNFYFSYSCFDCSTTIILCYSVSQLSFNDYDFLYATCIIIFCWNLLFSLFCILVLPSIKLNKDLLAIFYIGIHFAFFTLILATVCFLMSVQQLIITLLLLLGSR